jgi:phosphohistidine phosphatase
VTTFVIAVRHAKPEPGDSPPLSQEGRTTQQHMATLLRGQGHSLDRLYSSPTLRAQQTAEILAKELGGETHLEPALTDPFDAERLLSLIHQGETTLFVGHDPTLATFVNQLIGERVLPSGMVKSGALVVQFDGKVDFGTGRLIAYHKPANG